MSSRQIDTTALKTAVKAIEALDAQIKELNEDKTEAYAKARAAGLDTRILKALVHERRIPPEEFGAFQDLLALYRKELGR
jgi:uncharacterized protein (UPF0335 family)